MSCILFDSFTCNDLDALKCKITNEKYYEELRILEIICGAKQLWGNISPFGQGLLLLFLFD